MLAAALALAAVVGCELVLGDLPPVGNMADGGGQVTTGTTSTTSTTVTTTSTTVTTTSTTATDAGCEQGLTACDGGCVDEQTDPAHCGSCGNACLPPVSGGPTGTPKCGGGSCDVTCNAATPLDCAVTMGHACVDPQTDPQYCHDCNTHCPGGQTCKGGACVVACGPGLTSCGGTCVDLKSDPKHCGTCANGCTGGVAPFCSAGACALLTAGCGSGLTVCSVGGGLTACADTTKDPTHCGACGTACAADHVCVASTCTPYIFASAAWECGNGNSLPKYCPSSGTCVGATVTCP